jgi:16S rRNA (cytosine967-C5)-methyltransferase
LNNYRQLALHNILQVVQYRKSLSACSFKLLDVHSPAAQNLTFNACRFYFQLKTFIDSYLEKPFKHQDSDVFCILLLGSYELIFTQKQDHAIIFETVELCSSIEKQWATKLVNAILRQIQRDKEKLLKNKHFAHPKWIVNKLKKQQPKQYNQILFENNKQAVMSLRVNKNIDVSEYQKQLPIASKTIAIAPQALILEKPVAVSELPNFDEGSCFVQDISPQLAGNLLDPKNNELILDACAAPGGKTIHLSELAPKSTIIALDCDKKRLEKITENIERYQSKNITTLVGDAQKDDWWDGQLFDKILLDAPCSATGVIKRHPDIKLLRKESDIKPLVLLQQKILTNLWAKLKVGGTLLYATCSIFKEENEQQIIKFLKANQNAQEQKINLDWGDGDIGKQQYPTEIMDGFYYAKLIKS